MTYGVCHPSPLLPLPHGGPHLQTGAGQLVFNGGGLVFHHGCPDQSIRVLEQNINVANDIFTGGRD